MSSSTNGTVHNFERSDSDVTVPIENIDNENGGKKEKYEEINLKDLDTNGSVSVGENHLLSARTVRQISNMEEETAREKKRVSLLKQCSAIFRQGDQRYTKESLNKIFQDYFLLERIFQLFDVENKEHLVQDDWIEYLKERLGEEKQLEFVEQVESVAYVLCGDGVITLPAFQKILQNKVVTNKLLRVIDSDNDGYCTADEIMEFLTGVTSSRPRVGFDRESVEHLEKLFRETVGDQKEITRDQFKKIVVSKNPFFTERVFQIFDVDDSGAISLQEFLDAVQRFAGHAPDDKIRFLFKVYDLDGDGLIQHRELQHVLRACMEENGMQFNDLQLLQLTAAIMQDAAGGQGSEGGEGGKVDAITFTALRDQLHRHCGLRDNLTISIDRWLVPPKQAPKPTLLQRIATLKPHQFSRHYIRNNLVFVIHLLLFFGINLGLFASRCYEYRDTNAYLMIARGCGQCLNFSCSYILLPMLRGCATALRGRGAGAALPLDALRELHVRAAVLVCGASVAHTAAHIGRLVVYVVDDDSQNPLDLTLWEWLLTSRPKVLGSVPGCANPTGVALAVILAVMFVCSRPFVRRTGCFEIFYWTHLLYVPFWLLLLFHAPNFWKWFLIPGLLYTGERILRLIWLRSNRGKTYISSGIVLPSRVTHLVVKRPPHFEYCAGDYVFVNIPTVARYEWHPFTISSAPEQEEYIWLHIRGVGEWTNRLYSYFEEQQARLHAGELPAHSQVSRTISAQSNKSTKSKKKKSVDFSPNSYSNNGFTGDEGKMGPSTLLSPLRMLEKSHSMPNVHNKEKKKQALVAMRDYHRSESEHFDICQLSMSPSPQDLSKAYKSPQNKALAHSFRYMRNKPTIIAFKTPSMEDCERRRSNESIITLARRRLSKSISPDKDVENEMTVDAASPSESDSDGFENYPVGKPLEIYLDGPYGAPSSHIFRASHAVLVAAGIGVTPFAAILQSIMLRYWRAARRCANCGARATPDAIGGLALKKVDFFWINREQRSFEWFVSLLSQLEIEQAELGADTERFLEMHMYITSALQRTDMKAVGLQLALDLLHEQEKRDLITGLKTRTNAGRPNWDKVFQQLQEQNKGKVTVFFCGPPQLAKILRKKCAQFNFQFKKEVF